MHRLEVHRAGMVEAPLAGLTPLAERSVILKAYRARCECLRWTQVTRLRPHVIRCPQFVGTTLVYVGVQNAPVLYYNRLPFGGTPGSFWQDCQSGLNPHGSIVAFSAHLETNLLVVLMEEWIENAR